MEVRMWNAAFHLWLKFFLFFLTFQCSCCHVPCALYVMPRAKVPDDIREWIDGPGKVFIKNWLHNPNSQSQATTVLESSQDTVPACREELAGMGRGWPHDRQPDTTGPLGSLTDPTPQDLSDAEHILQVDMPEPRHDRQPDTTGPLDSTPQGLTDAERIMQEDIPEPRHIPTWAWPENRGKKRSFEWVTHDFTSQDCQHALDSYGPAQSLEAIQEMSEALPSVPQEFPLMWMMIWQCFRMCSLTFEKVQELSMHQDTRNNEDCNLIFSAMPKSSGNRDAVPARIEHSEPTSVLTPSSHGLHDRTEVPELCFRRRLKPLANGALPKVNDILAQAAQHGLYKHTSQFKWLDESNRAFQLRTPCQKACVNFYAATGSAFVTGLDKHAGVQYVVKWTDADTKQPRKRKGKHMGTSSTMLPPLTPHQALRFRGA